MKKTIKSIITLTMFLLAVFIYFKPFAGACFAQDNAAGRNAGEIKHEIDIFVDKAMDKDPSTAGMVKAAEEGEKMWDVELNKYYKLLSAAIDNESKAALKKAQLAWISFRDAEFSMTGLFYSKKDGTMYRVIAACTRLEIVKKRALTLKSLYEEHCGLEN